MRMNADSINLAFGPPASGATITLHPTNGITLQAGPGRVQHHAPPDQRDHAASGLRSGHITLNEYRIR